MEYRKTLNPLKKWRRRVSRASNTNVTCLWESIKVDLRSVDMPLLVSSAIKTLPLPPPMTDWNSVSQSCWCAGDWWEGKKLEYITKALLCLARLLINGWWDREVAICSARIRSLFLKSYLSTRSQRTDARVGMVVFYLIAVCIRVRCMCL